jgi:3-oxoacyl-[acyl-carrier protein] reductase
MGKLTDQIAVVTGASQGIGKDCAQLLADSGATVFLASRNKEILKKLEEDIRSSTGRENAAHALPTDVADEHSIKKSFRHIIDIYGHVDILVNNAGIAHDGLLLRMKRTDWDDVLNTNLTSMFLCIQQVLRSMLKRRQGRIINITSVVAQLGNPGQANYVASKAGIIGLTRSLAQEVASRNITVNAVAPGFIETAMTDILSEEVRAKLAGKIPLARLGQPRDVATAVAFLASEEANYITGQVLHVNGGLFLGG